jgi:thioesterase domain-containing protein
VEEIRRFQTEGPYYLGGMSFGGRVAFEIARQLHAQGQSVALLALLDSCPSGYARLLRQREGPIARAKRILGKVNSHWEALSAVPRGKRWEYVAKKVRTLQRRVKSKLWQSIYHLRSANVQKGNKILQNVKEANILASDIYLCKSYPGHVTVFRAMEESIDDIDPAPLWRQLAKGGVTVHATPGNHITLLSEPHVSVLAEKLKKSLEKAQEMQAKAGLTPTESCITSAPAEELKLAW